MQWVRLMAFVARSALPRGWVTTWLLVLAVGAAVGMQIPNTANLVGYSRSIFEEATTRGFGDVRVENTREPVLADGDALAERLATVPGVRAAVPIITLPAGLDSGGKQVVCELHGIDPASAWKPYRIRDGADLAGEGVLVGTGLAGRLGIRPGQQVLVRVILPGPPPSVAELTLDVRGTAQGAFGASWSLFVSRDYLARMMAQPRAATRVLLYAEARHADGLHQLREAGPHDAEALARAVVARMPEMTALTWMEENSIVESAFRGNEALALVSHIMVIIAVAIPVGALLYVTVESRRREIAMLLALGFVRSDVFVAVVFQALGIGLAGAVLGCGIGGAALAWFSDHPIFDSSEFTVRPVVSAAIFYEPALVIVLTTVVAALFPAWRATRVATARVLRGAT